MTANIDDATTDDGDFALFIIIFIYIFSVLISGIWGYLMGFSDPAAPIAPSEISTKEWLSQLCLPQAGDVLPSHWKGMIELRPQKMPSHSNQLGVDIGCLPEALPRISNGIRDLAAMPLPPFITKERFDIFLRKGAHPKPEVKAKSLM